VGGPATTICQCEAGFGVAWSPDGSIVFASEIGPLQRVPDNGGSPEAITEDTVFQIASCTKAFLAMLLAILIGDGLIDWDDPRRRRWSSFCARMAGRSDR